MAEEEIQPGWKMMLKIAGVLVGFIALCILIKYIFGV
jgi:nucleoside permease NupC